MYRYVFFVQIHKLGMVFKVIEIIFRRLCFAFKVNLGIEGGDETLKEVVSLLPSAASGADLRAVVSASVLAAVKDVTFGQSHKKGERIHSLDKYIFKIDIFFIRTYNYVIQCFVPKSSFGSALYEEPFIVRGRE